LVEQTTAPNVLFFQQESWKAAMYCPKCAAENPDQTKFCRRCGTGLEVIALALNNQPALAAEHRPTEENRIELAQQRHQLQIDGIHRLVRGAFIVAVGMSLGVPLYLFGKGTDWHSNWILVWLFMCGWLPVWGAIMMGTGVSNLIHSRMTQQKIDRMGSTLDAMLPIPGAPKDPVPGSVTEHTTLDLQKSGRTGRNLTQN